MKKSMRSFGIGVFLVGAALAGYDYLYPNQQTTDTKALEKQIKQYEQQIEELTQQITLDTTEEVTTETSEEPTEKAEEPTTSKDETPETSTTSAEQATDVIEATIYIYENVSIYTIGQQAEDLGIVNNGRELELFLAKPEYSRSIQKGAFDLRSDMTIEEMAKALTGKKLD